MKTHKQRPLLSSLSYSTGVYNSSILFRKYSSAYGSYFPQNTQSNNTLQVTSNTLLLLLCSPVYLWGLPFRWDFCECDFFQSNHWSSHNESSWMVHAGCVFVAGIHPSKMSARMFWVCAMECMYAKIIPWFTLSSERISGKWVRTHVTSKGKIPLTGKILLRGGLNLQRCIKQDSELNTLPMSYSSLVNLFKGC